MPLTYAEPKQDERRIRQLASQRILYFQRKIEKEFGVQVRCGAELEFYALSEHGDATYIDLEAVNRDLQPVLAAQWTPAGNIRKGAPLIEGVSDETLFCDPHVRYTKPFYEMRFGQGAGEWPRTHPGPFRIASEVHAVKENAAKHASRYGAHSISFEARPFDHMRYSSLGLHWNVSIYDKDDRNLFYDSSSGASDLCRHCAEALILVQHEGALLYAPHENSYKRLNIRLPHLGIDASMGRAEVQQRLEHAIASDVNIGKQFIEMLHSGGAPTMAAVKHNKMPMALYDGIVFPSVLVRHVDFSDVSPTAPKTPDGTRIEDRLAGADANPYLVAAANLGAMYRALKERTVNMDGSLATEGFTAHDYSSYPLPQSLEEAQRQFKDSALMKDILGTALHQAVLNSYQEKEIAL